MLICSFTFCLALIRFTLTAFSSISKISEISETSYSSTRRIETDGPLAPEYCRADMVDTLHREVWGQGFAPPTFSEEVQVLSQRLVGEGKNHLSIKLIHQGNPIDAIWFSHTEPLPARVLLAFRLDVNEWKGERKVQFLVEGAQL